MSERDVVEALKRQHLGYFLGPSPSRPRSPSPEGLERIRQAAKRLADDDDKEAA